MLRMSILIEALNRQIDQTIHQSDSTEAKMKIAAQCEMIKKVSIIAAIAAPIFAFFLPYVFGVGACLAIGLVGYDCFNIADNLGDAAKLSAQGGQPSPTRSNTDVLFDGTILTNWIVNRGLLGSHPQHNFAESMPGADLFQGKASFGKV